jgi:hypothetical protein
MSKIFDLGERGVRPMYDVRPSRVTGPVDVDEIGQLSRPKWPVVKYLVNY